MLRNDESKVGNGILSKKQIHVKKILIFYKKMLRVIDWESSENHQWELLDSC